MNITQSEKNNVLIVTVTGRLTADCAEQFKRHMSGIVPDKEQIVLDLSGMEYIDSTGLGAMVFFLQKFTDEGRSLKLAALQPKPRIVFNITKAYKIFDIYETVDAAVEAMNE